VFVVVMKGAAEELLNQKIGSVPQHHMVLLFIAR
jgi:hypothetical protein